MTVVVADSLSHRKRLLFMPHDRYISARSPTRYATDEMQYLFSEDNKFRTWRQLWIALARAETAAGPAHHRRADRRAGGPHGRHQLRGGSARVKSEVRHDVMSHVYAYGLQCPKAAGHHPSGRHQLLCGRQHRRHHHARGASQLVRRKLLSVHGAISRPLPEQYKDMPCLAYTHLQPAQLTTVGKRATLWMQRADAWTSTRSGPSARRPGAAGRQGHHRHPGQLHGAVRRRCGEGQGSGGA